MEYVDPPDSLVRVVEDHVVEARDPSELYLQVMDVEEEALFLLLHVFTGDCEFVVIPHLPIWN